MEKSELFIVEGDSALGTAKLARNSEFQALLPIRGKILNVQKASVADMLKNAECASIIQVIGAGSGRSFELEAARYGKVIIMTDAAGGAHIRCLLAALFFSTCPTCRGAPASPSPCTGSSWPTRRRGWTSTSTPTPTRSCSGSSPS
jgi:DNA gyrase subunit B